MKQYSTRYYRTARGEYVVSSWMAGLDKGCRALVLSKINRLEENGLLLTGQQTLRRIAQDFFELKAGQSRVGVYHDTEDNVFVLLCGWKKQKGIQRDDIARARSFMEDYKARKRTSHA